MKLQYLGDVKDCFKWDYLDYLVSELGYRYLNIAFMMTPDDSSRDGNLEPSGFDARRGIVEFCKELQQNRSLDYVKKLPEVSGSTYSIAFHKDSALFKNNERFEYFSGIDGKEDQVFFLDPDNGFEPEKSCNEKHVKYSDIEEILGRLSEKSIVVVFQHHRRKAFSDDFMGIKERITSGYTTAIYWQSLMFVAISKSEEVMEGIIEANQKYSEINQTKIIAFNREAKYIEDEDSFYRAIGKFAVKYEHLSFALQTGIIWCLHKEGLRNQQLSQIATANLTMQPLASIFQSMIFELNDPNEQEKQILNEVFKRIQNVSEKRNLVIHCNWFVGYGGTPQGDFSEVSGVKFHRNKRGASAKIPKYGVSDFEALSEDCDDLRKLVFHIWICMLEGFRISKFLQINEDSKVSIIKGSNH